MGYTPPRRGSEGSLWLLRPAGSTSEVAVDMEMQPRLFQLAVEDLHAACHFVVGEGWQLRIGARRQGDGWPQSLHREYERLSSSELVDVLSCELVEVLGL